MPEKKKTTARGDARGFTAVEALVSVAVLAIVVLFAVTMFQNSNRISRSATIQGDSQQSARVAIDLITKDLRSLGYDLDLGGGQQGLLWAGPWDVIFNANITPAQDDPMAPGAPAAINVGLAPAAVPAGGVLYAPAVSFVTGAETIRYTLDSNGDGAIDNADVGDDPEESTPNPNDFVLRKEIYGDRGDGTNGGIGEPVAIVRGPLPDAAGTLPPPLFQYWLDDDDDTATPEVLHGDADGDGQLDQAEIAAIGPVPAAELPLVTRAVIVVSAEDGESQGRGDYRTRQVVSSVSFRNFIRRTAVIAGTVFQDGDGNGSFDPTVESPIPGVTVRLSSADVTTSGANGTYVFEVTPGVYTVTELDPPGYVSTTTNTVSVTATTGASHQVDFGDRPGSGVAEIYGVVYHDENESRQQDPGERGIENVVVTVQTGQADTTDAQGRYRLDVPVGSFTVVETDSIGWGSTTPNVVEVILALDGQRQRLDFGDVPAVGSGTIRGVVYLDTDANGVRDAGEVGIADVPVVVSGRDSVVTDGTGQFSFTVPVGIHSVREYDLAGYSSSTPNVVTDIEVRADSTVTVEFGDIYEGSVNFTVVAIGTTDRALSITSTDLKEDNRGDPDIILGTQLTTGSNNLHVWHNQRLNSATPITALFQPTPTFSRSAGGPIPAMLRLDLNADGVMDLLAGLEQSAAPNLKLWQTITSPAGRGTYPISPDFSYQTFGGSTVLCLTDLQWPGWNYRVILVGTRTSSGAGSVEVWLYTGGGVMSHGWSSDLSYDGRGALGKVTALAIGDFDRNGYPDVAVGQDMGYYQGRVTIFRANPEYPFTWEATQILDTEGAVLSLAAVNMAEDSRGDIDLLVGTSRAAGAGRLELWLNNEGRLGEPPIEGDQRRRSDWVDTEGEVLCLGTARLDRDVFPDLLAGLRTTLYTGRLTVYRTFGYLPSSGSSWTSTASGEIVTMSINDFNIDGLKDIAVGTRTSVSTGELVVYFGR